MSVQTISYNATTSTSPGLRDSLRVFSAPRFRNAKNAILRLGQLPSNHPIDKTKRNIPVAACNLPADVIRKIFITCAILACGESDWSWVSLSYVCSSWRHAALECQELWRHIDFSNPKGYAITWRRANTSPLYIKTTVTNTNICFLHQALQMAHRIQCIHISSSVEQIQPLLEVLTHPNPGLESLIVDIHSQTDGSDVAGFEPPTFPTTGPPLENLKYLELHRTPFYLLTLRYPYLSHLHLHDLGITERPTRRYFFFMLEQFPKIRSLTLDRAFPLPSDDAQSFQQRISLPMLEILNLVGNVSEISDILDFTIIPPSSRMVFKILDLNTDMSRLAKFFNSHLSEAGKSHPLETVVLTGHESCCRYTDGFKGNPEFRQSLRLRGFRDSEVDGAIDISLSPEIYEPNDGVLITALMGILQSLSLSHIHMLAVQNLDILTQKSWSQFLDALGSLRVLDITGRAPSGLFWAVLSNARSQQDLGTDGECGNLLVPLLKDIYIHEVDLCAGGFMVAKTSPVNSHRDLDDSRFLDVLTTSLKYRQQFGLSLRSLSISRCQFLRRTAIEEARKVVSHFICDLRNLTKVEDIPAHYSNDWHFVDADIRHYYRLHTLIQPDSEVN